jgi:hypothetical protein
MSKGDKVEVQAAQKGSPKKGSGWRNVGKKLRRKKK